MKKLFIYFLPILFIAISCGKEPAYKISGVIEGLGDSYVYLEKEKDFEWVKVDSVKAESGEFSFSGTQEHPEMVLLKFDVVDTDPVSIFIENTDIKIQGSLDNEDELEITGSESQKEYEKFLSKIDNYDKEIEELYREFHDKKEEGDNEKSEQIEEEYMAVLDNKIEFIKDFVWEHTESTISPFITSNQLFPYIEYEELDSLYSDLTPSVKETKYGKRLKERRDILSDVQIGKPFIDFTLPNPEGEEITFSDYVGDDYVLLDFWASWCNPCRQENPILVENYRKFNDEGFEIVGVSLDQNKDAWIKAIENDEINWPQASNLNGWENEPRKEYGVMAIPANFLIDEEGRIVAKDLRGEELTDKLEEIYSDS
ncbi:MAG: TlpA disulfide reductase family protein [Bacteroidales bacterium]